MNRTPPISTLFPYTTLFRSEPIRNRRRSLQIPDLLWAISKRSAVGPAANCPRHRSDSTWSMRSEEHTSELQSRGHLVCRLLLEKKKQDFYIILCVALFDCLQ